LTDRAHSSKNARLRAPLDAADAPGPRLCPLYGQTPLSALPEFGHERIGFVPPFGIASRADNCQISRQRVEQIVYVMNHRRSPVLRPATDAFRPDRSYRSAPSKWRSPGIRLSASAHRQRACASCSASVSSVQRDQAPPVLILLFLSSSKMSCSRRSIEMAAGFGLSHQREFSVLLGQTRA